MMKVWYSLNGRMEHSVKIASDLDISGLKNAIIAENPPLQSLSPRALEVYGPGTHVSCSRWN